MPAGPPATRLRSATSSRARTRFFWTPTIGAGWEPIDNLRIGLGLIWGIATIDFANFSAKSNADFVGAGYHANDIKGEIKGKDLFIPGATAGVIWSATDSIDVAGWYKVVGDIKAKGDIITTAQGAAGQGLVKSNTADTDCGAKSLNATCVPGSVRATIPIPMEAKLGFRYHMLRPGVNTRHVRDPMAQDVFDLEADLTWAHDSQFQAISIGRPGGRSGERCRGDLHPDGRERHPRLPRRRRRPVRR